MKRLFLFLLLFGVFSCDSTFGTPEGVISERKMISILTELQVAESKVKNLKISADSARHVFSIYEMKILSDHNVTSEEYLRSYEYYLDNHRLMTRVHQAVLDTLMARQTKVEQMPDIPLETAAPEVANDSIPKDTVVAQEKDSVLLQELPSGDPVGQVKDQTDSLRKNLRKKSLRKRDLAN